MPQAADTAEPDRLRADLILTAAIAAFIVLVIGFLAAFAATTRQHAEVAEVVRHARATRGEIIELLTAQNQGAAAVYAAAAAPAEPSYLDAYRRNADAARARLAQMRRLAAEEDLLARLTAEIDARSQAHFAVFDEIAARPAAMRARLPDASARAARIANRQQVAIDALQQRLNTRIDNARGAEDSVRTLHDVLAAILAVLSIAAAALAIWAQRRERSQWAAANTALEAARAAAAQSDLAKTRFLATASHDMRQPLHAITLYLTALQRRVDNPEARDIIDKMERATQSMSGMFSTLLDLARMQASVIKPDIVAFPLQDVLERVIAQHPGAIIAANAQLEPLMVSSDPNLLERLLRNLVSNALKHGGGAAQIEVVPHGDKVEIAVVDRGPGIAEEDQARIFEEFVRLDGRSEGLGLGLSIVSRLADLLGVEVEVRSALGVGSMFLVRAPLDPSSAAPAAPPQAAPDALAGAKVLALDDDALALSAVTQALSDLGAEARGVASEAAALAALDEGFRPALLVMDLRIADQLVGVDIANRLQARIEPKPAVIVVTGDTAPETLAMLRASGHAWLIKPVAPADLARAAARARAAA